MWLKKENSKKSEKYVGTENLPYKYHNAGLLSSFDYR